MRPTASSSSGRVSPVRFALALALAAAASLHASGESVPLNPFDLPPGQSVTITFDVDVDDPLAICALAISNQGTVTATNSANVLTDDPDVAGAANPTVSALDVVDLAITKSDGVTTAVPGGSVTYTITASNSGPSPALNALVADTFPAAISSANWTCVGAGGGTCTAAGSGNLADSVNLPVGGSVTYTVTAQISAAATGSLVNTATVTKAANQIECNVANNSATDTDTLTPQADFGITKTDGLTDVNAGAPTTYTIVVTNAGPSNSAATVADTFPAALTGVSWSCVPSIGSTCTAGPVAGNINDSVSVLAGGSLTYTANATVSGSATGTLSNTATVTGAATDPVPGNNSATDTTNILPVADLSITKTDGVSFAVPGLTVTYTIVASNSGPATATGASVADTFPAACASVSWTCVGAGGGTCTAGPTAGNIADSVNLPASATVTYTAVCTLANAASGSLVNTATISGGGVSDTTPGNNSATDTDTILPLDFGDAPTAAQSGFATSYPTTLASNGARHAVNGGGALRMGAQIDTEPDGQPTAAADGDDQTAPPPNVDDEDGVTLPAAFVTCEGATVTVNASAAGMVDAFVDWNRDGDFDDVGEKVLNSANVVAGNNALLVAVPCSATPSTQSFARFRLSTAGGLGPTGVAPDGEVEDHVVVVRGLDFGDAPDPTFPTLFASNGARHVVTGSGPRLGTLLDVEPEGQPTAAATGDDVGGIDDEDGVTFPSPLVRGQAASISVTASAPGILSAWFDWNADGDWLDAGENTVTNQAVVAGPNTVNFVVPPTAVPGAIGIARFRVATAGGLSFTGLAADGEVEDHAFTIASEADLQITKSDGATTEVPGTPVTYTITVTNAGPNAATAVAVADTFPAILSGCTWTSVAAGGATGNSPAGAGNIAESGLNLPNGSSVTYTATCNISAAATGTLVNTATVSSSTIDPVPGNNSATDTDTLTPQTDLAITKTDGATTEVPGTPVTYTIVVTNAGPSDAVGALVSDTFPATISGVTWTCVGANGGTCPANGSGNLASVSVNLPAAGGATVTFTATGNIAASATGSLSNTASVAAAPSATDPVPGNNSATDTDTLTPQADLSITKTDGATTEVPGTPVTYTITASNAGPSDAPSSTVADTFPATIGGVTWTCVGAGGGTCPANGAGNLSASVNLPAGGSVTFTATGTISSAATGSLSNTATVAAPGGVTDPAPANNSATDTDTLVPSADLEITKDDSADPPPAGQDLVYTLTVTNHGPSDAAGVTVTDPLPAAVTYVSDDCGGTNTPPWTWSIGALAANANVVCHLTVSINPAPPASISNTATVSATTADPVGGNNSDTELTQLDAVPPTVTNVDSVADTGDGTLAECETATVSITALRVTFDEAMADPPGDGTPGDVTNPASWLLVAPGADRDFATTACGGAAGDDVAIAIASIAYDGGSDTATLSFAAPLAPSQLRLFACDELTDVAGNPLDGDGDTNAGGDFRRAFRADPGNLFGNGHFDCDASDWNPVAPAPGEITWTGLEDFEDADASGSVHFTNLAPGVDTSFRLWQCYPVPPAPRFDVASRVRLDAASAVFIGFSRRCEFFAGAGCTSSLGVVTQSLLLADTGGAWLDVASTVAAPGGSTSARCDFRFDTATGASFDAYLDATRFFAAGALFSDGFESGNTSAWSATVP